MNATTDKPKLHILLKPGRRFRSYLLRSAGVVLEHFHGADGWDWYHVSYDIAPGLRHQARRDSFLPLKLNHRPLYAPIPAIE